MASRPLHICLLMLVLLGSRAATGQELHLELRALTSDAPATSLQAALDGRRGILVFWRSDCEPCIEELQRLQALKRAARDVPILLIGLESPEGLRSTLDRLKLPSSDSWYTDTDPAEVLIRFGSNPPRLPLSVMIDAAGAICNRRIGQLGPALVTEWLERCVPKSATGADP